MRAIEARLPPQANSAKNGSSLQTEGPVAYLFLGERPARAKEVHKARGDASVDVEDERFPLLGGHL